MSPRKKGQKWEISYRRPGYSNVKLQISGGNIKAVQGDTGHAQARMVTDLYAHTNTEDRRRLAQRMEQDFFQSSKQPIPDG